MNDSDEIEVIDGQEDALELLKKRVGSGDGPRPDRTGIRTE